MPRLSWNSRTDGGMLSMPHPLLRSYWQVIDAERKQLSFWGWGHWFPHSSGWSYIHAHMGSPNWTYWVIRNRGGGWRDGFVIKSTDCSSRSPGFSSQQPDDSSQPYVFPVPGDMKPSSGLLSHQTHMWCSDIHSGKTPHTCGIIFKFVLI